MTFKFTYSRKEIVKEELKLVTKSYDIKLTNGLIIDIEEAYDLPIHAMWKVVNRIPTIMSKGKLAIYVAVLNHLAVIENDRTLFTTLQVLKEDTTFNLNSKEVILNCVAFINCFMDQQDNFKKLELKNAKATKATKSKKK